MSDKSKYELDTEARLGAEKMPEPSPETIDRAAHILSEWLDDAAPLHERRYRNPARSVLKFAAYLSASSLSEAGDGWQLVGGQNIQHIGELAAVFASLPIGRPVVVNSQFHEAAMVLADLVTRSRLPAPPRDEVK